jgi:hypothetical protein
MPCQFFKIFVPDMTHDGCGAPILIRPRQNSARAGEVRLDELYARKAILGRPCWIFRLESLPAGVANSGTLLERS